jgi:hypothetical protein
LGRFVAGVIVDEAEKRYDVVAKKFLDQREDATGV